MFKKNLVLAIGSLLLIQFTTCLPKPSTSESAEDNTITHGSTTTMSSVGESAASSDRQRLGAFVFTAYNNFLNFCLRRINQIAKDVLADPSLNSINSQAMESQRNTFMKYVKDSKEALNLVMSNGKNEKEKNENRFSYADGKQFVIDKFDNAYRSRLLYNIELTAEQQILWEALKKHGASEYIVEVEKRSNDLAFQIVDEFEKYINTLSVAEKEKEKEFVELWNKFTNNELHLNKAQFGKKLFRRLFRIRKVIVQQPMSH